MDKWELKEIIDNNIEVFDDGESNVYYDIIFDKIRYKILKSEYKYLAQELSNLSSEIEILEEINDNIS